MAPAGGLKRVKIKIASETKRTNKNHRKHTRTALLFSAKYLCLEFKGCPAPPVGVKMKIPGKTLSRARVCACVWGGWLKNKGRKTMKNRLVCCHNKLCIFFSGGFFHSVPLATEVCCWCWCPSWNWGTEIFQGLLDIFFCFLFIHCVVLTDFVHLLQEPNLHACASGWVNFRRGWRGCLKWLRFRFAINFFLNFCFLLMGWSFFFDGSAWLTLFSFPFSFEWIFQ